MMNGFGGDHMYMNQGAGLNNDINPFSMNH